MPPLLSIIIPCRNDAHKLSNMLDSLLGQTFKDFETLVIDDCSDIPYCDLIDGYRAKGLNLKLETSPQRIYTKHARLQGVVSATGRIIMFADADDILWTQDALSKNIDLFLANDADIVHFPSVIVDQSGKFSRYFHCADPLAPNLMEKDILAAFMHSDWEGSVIWNKLFSRQLWLNNLAAMRDNPIQRYSEDLFLNIYAMMHASKYVGSEYIGYGFYCVNSKYSDRYVHNAMALTKMLNIIVPRLRELGFDDKVQQAYKNNTSKWICLFTGRTADKAEKDEYGMPTDNTIERLLEIGDNNTLLKTLLHGNAINAARLTNIYKRITE